MGWLVWRLPCRNSKPKLGNKSAPRVADNWLVASQPYLYSFNFYYPLLIASVASLTQKTKVSNQSVSIPNFYPHGSFGDFTQSVSCHRGMHCWNINCLPPSSELGELPLHPFPVDNMASGHGGHGHIEEIQSAVRLDGIIGTVEMNKHVSELSSSVVWAVCLVIPTVWGRCPNSVLLQTGTGYAWLTGQHLPIFSLQFKSKGTINSGS